MVSRRCGRAAMPRRNSVSAAFTRAARASRRNSVEAAKWFEKAAEQGVAAAQVNIADISSAGTGVARDAAKRRNGFGGRPIRAWRLPNSASGIFISAARVSPRDPQTGVVWLRRAAEAGDPEAQTALGVLYARGEKLGQDLAHAELLIRQAACPVIRRRSCSSGTSMRRGRSTSPRRGRQCAATAPPRRRAILEAQRILAWNYLNGRGVAEDAAAAALWFRKAAEQGDAGAQFQLAAMYCTGAGVVRNLEEAVKWYRRSAEQGDRYAQYNLGVMLLKGQGVLQDAEAAFGWCRAAAEQGLAEAQLQLGDLYRAGLGTTEDLLTARAWYEKAAAQEQPEAAARSPYSTG